MGHYREETALAKIIFEREGQRNPSGCDPAKRKTLTSPWPGCGMSHCHGEEAGGDIRGSKCRDEGTGSHGGKGMVEGLISSLHLHP